MIARAGDAMPTEPLDSGADAEVRLAAARSRAYAAFGRLFEYPDAAVAAEIRSGASADELARALDAIDPRLASDAARDALRDAGEGDALAVEFTRLFDVGASGPPCPLYGGAYGSARMKTMEEVLRFYKHFGLTLAESQRELPDHLATELEFLHFLAFREAETLAAAGDPGPWRRAQRDFIARHPGRWMPQLLRRLERETPLPYFRELVTCLVAFLASDSERLERALASR